MATATNKTAGGDESTPRRSDAFDKAQADQAAMDELEASRARVAELEKTLGVTAVGQARAGGLRGEIQALLRERVGYLRRAQNPEEKERMDGRVSQVDDQLSLRGYRVGKDLDKDTAEAFEAAGPGVRIEDAITEREARQTIR